MSRANVELDFFGMERDSSNKSQFQKFLHRHRSFRGGFQNAMSKINPEMLKTVISSNGVNSSSPPSSPNGDRSRFSPLPLFVPNGREICENVEETIPLTIFYNGSVSVFNVPREKAQSILKIAVQGSSNNGGVEPSSQPNQSQIIESLNGDLPIARRKSLQRFLEKRKERLTTVSPYGCRED